MQAGASGGCGGSGGGVRICSGSAEADWGGANCAADAVKIEGTLYATSAVRAKKLILEGGVNSGRAYLGVMHAGGNNDVFGLQLDAGGHSGQDSSAFQVTHSDTGAFIGSGGAFTTALKVINSVGGGTAGRGTGIYFKNGGSDSVGVIGVQTAGGPCAGGCGEMVFLTYNNGASSSNFL